MIFVSNVWFIRGDLSILWSKTQNILIFCALAAQYLSHVCTLYTPNHFISVLINFAFISKVLNYETYQLVILSTLKLKIYLCLSLT